MGLNLVLYDLGRFQQDDLRNGESIDLSYLTDERFDWLRHIEDRDFVAWLNARNAVFKVIATPDALAEAPRWYGDAIDSSESLVRLLEERGGFPFREALPFAVHVFERPKDFAAARAWVRNYVHPYPGIWDQQRYWHLLDLLESDENLWLFEDG